MQSLTQLWTVNKIFHRLTPLPSFSYIFSCKPCVSVLKSSILNTFYIEGMSCIESVQEQWGASLHDAKQVHEGPWSVTSYTSKILTVSLLCSHTHTHTHDFFPYLIFEISLKLVEGVGSCYRTPTSGSTCLLAENQTLTLSGRRKTNMYLQNTELGVVQRQFLLWRVKG